MRWTRWALPALAALLCACGAAPPAGQAYGPRPSSVPASQHSQPPASGASATAAAAPSASREDGSASGRNATAPPILPAAARGGHERLAPTAAGILHGQVILVDPGHNGGNIDAATVINKLIWNGRESETCDTTGAQTDAGYTEALFNWNVARYLTADLRAEGATVVLTRTSDTGVGPCVTERAAIGNAARANAAVSIHADGGPPGGRGFAILEPVADGINDAIIGPSAVLGADLRTAFGTRTGEPVSTYDGVNGIQARSDLAGINLSTVPKVFVECANMRNAVDAALVTSPRWQAQAARAIAAGLSAFLTGAGLGAG
jgi:N-acetylmuramoyl-L-alanine amidase